MTRACPSPSAMTTVAVTGPLGFIGGRVVASLTAAGAATRGLVRRDPPADAAFQAVRGDLADRDGLAALVRGADAVVHTASSIGADENEARAVNVEGTRAVVAAAGAVGLPVLYVSTASVFGSGPHRGSPRDGATPESPTSRTRLEAERIVLEAAGAVVHPNVVYGAGDRWLFPGAYRLVTAVGVMPATDARVSAIHVQDLGRVVAGAALTGRTGVVPVHTAPPVTAQALIAATFDAFGAPLPEVVPVSEFRERAAGRGLGAHHLAMLLEDAWFDVRDPDPAGVVTLTDADRAWYAGIARGLRP